ADSELAHLASGIGDDPVLIVEHDAKASIGHDLVDIALEGHQFFLGHSSILLRLGKPRPNRPAVHLNPALSAVVGRGRGSALTLALAFGKPAPGPHTASVLRIAGAPPYERGDGERQQHHQTVSDDEAHRRVQHHSSGLVYARRPISASTALRPASHAVARSSGRPPSSV